MTTISKCLAIFTAIACMAFLAFASVSVVGGPNWQAKLNDEDLRDAFVFQPSESELPGWMAKNRRTNADVGRETDVIPELLVTARKQLRADQDAELRDLDAKIKQLELKLAETHKLIDADQPAIQHRFEELEKELKDLNAKIEEISKQGIQKSQEAQRLQAEMTRRTEDVFRLTSQLEQLRTERYQVLDQQRILKETLIGVRGANDRLMRRNQEMKDAGASVAK